VSDGSPVGTQIVIKAKHPASIEKMLRSDGFEDFIFAERLFMENENITEEIPETGDYFSILVASKRNSKNNGIVYFVGAGPGNPKYITVKGRELLDSADLVMYTGSLVNPELLDHVRAEKMDSHGMKLETMIEVMANTVRAGKTVVRLHSGDPSLYGAIIEQIDGLEKQGIGIKIIPGVTSLFASAASLQTQLTLNGITETLIITRPAGATLEKDSIKELSRHNATLAIYLGTHKLREIMDVVEYPKETPAAVVFHASWDDEKIIRGTVGDIADKVEAIGIERSAMIIIGNVLAPGNFKRSHLYG
jgi:precorrin-4/cobalt-precorrin-4 C11-methyltransferase